MAEYWALRVRDALNNSQNAPTSEAREVHLRVAEHYNEMRKLCALRPPQIAAAWPAQF